MAQDKEYFFINRLVDALEKVGCQKLNLDVYSRLLLIGLAKFADNKTGECWPLQSQLQNITGISADAQTDRLKILKEKGFITFKRKYDGSKKMTRNYYTIHLDVILSLSINDQKEVEVESVKVMNDSTNTEPNLPSKNSTNIEPTGNSPVSITCSNNEPNRQWPDDRNRQWPDDTPYISTTQKATTQKAKALRAIVQTGLDAPPETNVFDMPLDYYFEEFWAVYPRKEKKKDARTIWARYRLDSIADQIIDDVRRRQVRHVQWEDRSFIPLPTTYLNGERWNDDIIEKGQKPNGKISTPHAGNIRSYAEQLQRASDELGEKYLRAGKNNLGREVDEKLR